MEKRIKAWAVVNTDLSDVCVFVKSGTPDDSPETQGAALFTSDWEGVAEKEAREWRANNLPKDGLPEIKVVPCTISFEVSDT